MEKVCNKCGVVLCDKNYCYRNKKEIKNRCKSCDDNATFCRYNYNTIELQQLSKKRSEVISNKIYRKTNPEYNKKYLEKLRQNTAIKKEQKKDFYIYYIPQYKCCTKCNKSKPLCKFETKVFNKILKKTGQKVTYYRLKNICIACKETNSRKVLKTRYIANLLHLKPNEVPQELVELKRQQLKLYREYYNKHNKL